VHVLKKIHILFPLPLIAPRAQSQGLSPILRSSHVPVCAAELWPGKSEGLMLDTIYSRPSITRIYPPGPTMHSTARSFLCRPCPQAEVTKHPPSFATSPHLYRIDFQMKLAFWIDFESTFWPKSFFQIPSTFPSSIYPKLIFKSLPDTTVPQKTIAGENQRLTQRGLP